MIEFQDRVDELQWGVKILNKKVEAIREDIFISKQVMLIKIRQEVKIIEEQELLLSNLNNFKAVLSYFESEDTSILESQLLNLQARASIIHDLVTRNNVLLGKGSYSENNKDIDFC